MFEDGAVLATAEFAEHLKNGGASRTQHLDSVAAVDAIRLAFFAAA